MHNHHPALTGNHNYAEIHNRLPALTHGNIFL